MNESTLARIVRAALPAAASLLLGCSGEVLTQDQCGGGMTLADEGTRVVLSHPASGAFFGDTLHLEADIDGERRYVVIRVDSPSVAHLLSAQDALVGPANLVEVGAGAQARVRVAEDGAPHVDLVDLSDPAVPALSGSFTLEGTMEPDAAFSASDGYLYFCMTPPGEELEQLFSLDLRDPTNPGSPVRIESFLCNLFQGSGLDGKRVATGATWVTWSYPTGYWMQETYVYTVTPDSAHASLDYGYNQTGVHHYGNVVTSATDGERVVFDAENESLFLAADDLTDLYAPLNWMTFGITGPKRLLAVRSGAAYLARATGVRAYDVTDIYAPELLDYDAPAEFGDDLPTLVASSDRWLAITDSTGVLSLVPLDAPGAIEPLRVYDGGAPGAETATCDR